MYKVLIIDDEPLARSIVREYLKEYSQIEVAGECADGFEGVKAIGQYQPDLIFLDIQMPKINGFEMLELIDRPPSVIFTTAFDEYAIRAFEAHAVDYLLKPFNKSRFDKALRNWLSQRNADGVTPFPSDLLSTAVQTPLQQSRVVVRIGGKIKIIPTQDIRYIEAADDYVKIHTGSDSFLKNKTMQYFEQLLDARQFVRVHRSYIVNIQQVTRLEPYEKENYIAILIDGLKVPVSKTGYLKLKQVLGL